MDTMVKVHNRNKFDHKEMFQGREIFIPANGYLLMDYEEANRFLGQMVTPKFDKGGVQLATSYKWLEIDKKDKLKAEATLRNEQEEKATKIFVCMACNKEFTSKSALLKHSKNEHSDLMVEDKEEEE